MHNMYLLLTLSCHTISYKETKRRVVCVIQCLHFSAFIWSCIISFLKSHVICCESNTLQCMVIHHDNENYENNNKRRHTPFFTEPGC